MNFEIFTMSLSFGLFLGMLLLFWTGRWIGVRQMAKYPKGTQVGIGAIEGAVFGLLGLIIAFTFSGAGSRFDTRRNLIVEETNAVGTAYLRLDLLPADIQPALRENFRRYVDTRLEMYRKIPDIAAVKEELAKANRLQGEIWRQAVDAARAQGSPPAATMLLLPAVNAMIDLTTTRTMAARIHPPVIIFVMLFGLALVSALVAGYGTAGSALHSWLPIFGFAAVVAVSVYVILDLEFPRLGLIRLDVFDQTLIDLRKSMN